MSRATDFGLSTRRATAWLTPMPRIWSTTRRVFCADDRRYIILAFATMCPLPSMNAGCRLLGRGDGRGLLALGRVPLERPGEAELAQLVADHALRHVDGDELLPVVDGDRVPDELREDRGAARPGLDDLLLELAVHFVDTLPEMRIDPRALLDRSA